MLKVVYMVYSGCSMRSRQLEGAFSERSFAEDFIKRNTGEEVPWHMRLLCAKIEEVTVDERLV